MEAVSALRIGEQQHNSWRQELYEELQGLPEGLRSEFPDLAIDFLATVFKPLPATGKALSSRAWPPAAARPMRSPLVPFQLPAAVAAAPVAPQANGSSASGDCLASMQSMLAELKEEAAAIEATASATPAGGWGELALPAPRAGNMQASQHGGTYAASSAAALLAAPPGSTYLLECQRCHRVLLAGCALQHQQQCSQQPELALPTEPSVSLSSSDGMPAMPSASRGSKRKHLPAVDAARTNGCAVGKQSRLSKGCGSSLMDGSAEASPSIGEVVQGALRVQLPQPAAPIAPAGDSSAVPWMAQASAQPLSPTIRLTKQQRRQRSQHVPRMRRRYLHTHPGRDLPEPLLLNMAARPATGSVQPAMPVPASVAVASVVDPGGDGDILRKMSQPHLIMRAPAAAAVHAAPVMGLSLPRPAAPSTAHRTMPWPTHGALLPAAASSGAAMAGVAGRSQQYVQQAQYQEQCRIFQSLLPEQQLRIKQLAQQRVQQQTHQQAHPRSPAEQQQQQLLHLQGQQQQQPASEATGKGAHALAGRLRARPTAPIYQARPAAPPAVLSPQEFQPWHENSAVLRTRAHLHQQQAVPVAAAMGQALLQHGQQTRPARAMALQLPYGTPAVTGIAAAPGTGSSLLLLRPSSTPPIAQQLPQHALALPLASQLQHQFASNSIVSSQEQQPVHCDSSAVPHQGLPMPGVAVMGIPLDSCGDGAGSTAATFSSSLLPAANLVPQQQLLLHSLPIHPFVRGPAPVTGGVVGGMPVVPGLPRPTFAANLVPSHPLTGMLPLPFQAQQMPPTALQQPPRSQQTAR